MEPMFKFDPQTHAPQYAAEGFVHIRRGLTPAFLGLLDRQVDEYLRGKLLAEFAIGDKQQALYQFPEGGDYHGQLLDAVSTVCGLERKDLVLSERHIKAYDGTAAPQPLPHKDRFASQVSVGFSVRVPPGSTLVLYPYDELDINPFNSSTEYRASLSTETVPEKTLKHARRVELADEPGDVVIFRGHAIWHLRERPAHTVMLYLKLNAFHSDPLGEDAGTVEIRRHTEAILAGSEDALETATPILGRRVDCVQRRFGRDWREVIGVVLYGEKHYTISEAELRALQGLDGRRSAAGLIKELGRATVCRLAKRGVIDLLPPSRTPGATAPAASSFKAATAALVS